MHDLKLSASYLRSDSTYKKADRVATYALAYLYSIGEGEQHRYRQTYVSLSRIKELCCC